ncbi:hypothetical protein [Kamptonema formosum]|uniref:hypothetical protein n=1 Tax=Kamptonema formosum TaxID=331992 RepID=UPI00034BD802|nr:hypothetical protein [Oscillatoria sp. PCC 10802]
MPQPKLMQSCRAAMASTSALAGVPVPALSRRRQVFAPRQMAREAQQISEGARPRSVQNLLELVPQDGWPDERPLRLFRSAGQEATVWGVSQTSWCVFRPK